MASALCLYLCPLGVFFIFVDKFYRKDIGGSASFGVHLKKQDKKGHLFGTLLNEEKRILIGFVQLYHSYFQPS